MFADKHSKSKENGTWPLNKYMSYNLNQEDAISNLPEYDE